MEPLEAHLNGWTLRGVYDEPRLTELIQLYEDLGFSVSLENRLPRDRCSACMKNQPDRYRVLYTKKIDSSAKTR